MAITSKRCVSSSLPFLSTLQVMRASLLASGVASFNLAGMNNDSGFLGNTTSKLAAPEFGDLCVMRSVDLPYFLSIAIAPIPVQPGLLILTTVLGARSPSRRRYV